MSLDLQRQLLTSKYEGGSAVLQAELEISTCANAPKKLLSIAVPFFFLNLDHTLFVSQRERIKLHLAHLEQL